MERDQEIIQLEKDVQTLNDVMVDLALLTDAQSFKITCIEDNIESSKIATKAATKEIIKANKHTKKSKTKYLLGVVTGCLLKN